MRLLHTSDWHLGRSFHGHDLLADQRVVLCAIADLVREHSVDAVLVAGDLYDRAVPSADAMRLAAEAISAIRAAGAQVVVTSGNHDSAARLGVFTDLLAAGGLHLITDLSAIGRPVLLPDPAGPVAVYGIPYLEPEIMRPHLAPDGPASHTAVTTGAVARIRADLASRPAGTRAVVLAHTFVVGGTASGSERSIAVGGVQSVPAELFDGFSYTALGHLHGRQTLGPALRYSGSPLPYSFTETHRKGAWLVELDGAEPAQVSWLELPTVRPLATRQGHLAELLADPAGLADHYLAVELTDPVRPMDPMRRLREVYPFALTISWQPDGAPAADPRPVIPVAGQSDDATIEAFLLDCRGVGPDSDERELISSVLTAVRSGSGG